MGIDYYSILSINRTATDADIKRAYRKLALKYHPQRNADDNLAAEKFQQIGEAYDVLSDLRKRATFDQFGEEGLKHGVPPGSGALTVLDPGHGCISDITSSGMSMDGGMDGAWTTGYTFHGDAEKVFRDFFGGDNPYQEFYDRVDGDMSMGFGGLKGRGAKKQDPALERDLALGLEEIFHGCTKKMKISRRVMNEDGHTSSIKDKILTICVKKGWRPGTRITFTQEGDQGPNIIPADITFVVKDKPHESFRRDGADLLYTANISLSRALTGTTLEIHTLDERILHIPITDIVSPGYKKVVPGEGMPQSQNPEEKGDLVIDFNIIFPQSLKPDKKALIKKALP